MDGRYSLVEPRRAQVPVEQAPPPSPHPGQWHDKRAPWWAGWVLALIPVVGGAFGWVGKVLIESSNKQLEMLTQIKADVRALKEDQADSDNRIDALEHRERKKFESDEKQFAVLFAALAQEGYVPPRGAPEETKQVKFRSTKNARKPLKAVTNDGRELTVPPAAAPPSMPP